jgi:hypothetical protein
VRSTFSNAAGIMACSKGRKRQWRMPYELSFTKKLQLADTEQYINECCIGGDIVLEVFLPQLRREYGWQRMLLTALFAAP